MLKKLLVGLILPVLCLAPASAIEEKLVSFYFTYIKSGLIETKVSYISIVNADLEISLDRINGYMIDNGQPINNKINIKTLNSGLFSYNIFIDDCVKKGEIIDSSTTQKIDICGEDSFITITHKYI